MDQATRSIMAEETTTTGAASMDSADDANVDDDNHRPSTGGESSSPSSSTTTAITNSIDTAAENNDDHDCAEKYHMDHDRKIDDQWMMRKSDATKTSSTVTSSSNLSDLFGHVVKLVRDPTVLSPAVHDDKDKFKNDDVESKMSDQDKLRLYGLYKLIHDGPCCLPPTQDVNEDGCNESNTRPQHPAVPSVFQPVARAKYFAWKECSEKYFSDIHQKHFSTLPHQTIEAAAMTEYIQLVASKNDRLGRHCQRLWKQYCQDELATTHDDATTATPCASTDGNGVTSRCNKSCTPKTTHAASATVTTSKSSESEVACSYHYKYNYPTKSGILDGIMSSLVMTVQKAGGIQPMLPRGRLDISYSDLWYAMQQSFVEMVASSSIIGIGFGIGRRNQHHSNDLVSENICQLWEDATGGRRRPSGAVGLSVRSLFDLYLTSKGYPTGSEIIVAPPISVPGMMLVAKYHGLNIVPVDINIQDNKNDDDCNAKSDNNNKWVDVQGILSKITEQTVAIMIVHPFGIVTVDNDTMKELRAIADSKDLEIWEDCAECFVGLGMDRDSQTFTDTSIVQNKNGPNFECYLGDDLADLRFFSFGNIKTSTALGGGIAIFRDRCMCKEIIRLQKALFSRQQEAGEYLVRVFTALILNFIAASPLRVGLLVFICKFCRLNFESVVTSSVRGFRVSNNKLQTEKTAAFQLIKQIRKRPSNALLKLLLRRLKEARTSAPLVAARISQCQRVESLLRRQLPEVLLRRTATSTHTCWTYPITVDCNRADVSKIMHEMGFDVVNGASQLCSVARFTTKREAGDCKQTDRLMDSILYLPICSQEVPDNALVQLVACLRQAVSSNSVTGTESAPSILNKTTLVEDSNSRFSKLVGFLVATATVYLLCASTLDFIHSLMLFGCAACLSVFVLCVGAQAILQWSTADFYLQQSSSFAEHCDMIQANFHEGCRVRSGNSILSDVEALNLVSEERCASAVLGRSVVLTGATGFVGSALLRDLLDNRNRLNVSRIIIVCRSKGGLSAPQRIEKLMRDPMFGFCAEHEKKQLIEVIEGDVTQPYAGLNPFVLDRIYQDASISHVFHCAAVVSFMQEFPDAARSNITSALTLQSMTSRLKTPGAVFVHVSTAFVHGDQTGSRSSPLPEDLFCFDPFDPHAIYQSMLGTQYYASKAMNELGFHNTYSFSKSVCEHLLARNQRIKTIIFRPSIVGPAAELPFEGWAGDRPSTIVAGPCLHLSNQWNIWCLGQQIVPCIPVDVLSRFILSKTFGSDPVTIQSTSDTVSSSDGSFEHVGKNQETFDQEDCSSAESSESMESNGPTIYNATWNVTCNEHAAFSWLDFSVAYLHLGSMLGMFTRTNALIQILISVQIMPKLSLSLKTFETLHHVVIRRPTQALASAGEKVGFSMIRVEKVLSFLDLPVLFYPFMRADFVFQSDIIAPESFDAKRYAFSCGVAAYRFISAMKYQQRQLTEKPKMGERLKFYPIGGKLVDDGGFHVWWAFSQPVGGFFFKCAGAFVRYLLYLVTTVVSIDIISFREHLSAQRSLSKDGPVFLVLAPTHRSCMDFILLSYAFFSLPELQIGLPYIVAADDFYFVPLVGWLASRFRAFYIRRGRHNVDKKLVPRLKDMKDQKLTSPRASLEVFIEGRRSRDRRFIRPRTGFLKCLHESGGSHVILPITISYECIPEQKILVDEAAGLSRSGLRLSSTMKWLWNAASGYIRLGKIHISAGNAISVRSRTTVNFARLVHKIQTEQQSQVVVSEYHTSAASAFFNVDDGYMRNAMRSIGCRFWPGYWQSEQPEIPTDRTTLFSIVLQFGHLISPLLPERQKKWAEWLDCASGNAPNEQIETLHDRKFADVFQSIIDDFDSVDQTLDDALTLLKERGFQYPKPSHVFQTAKSMNAKIPLCLLNAAISLRSSDFMPEGVDNADLFDDKLLDDASLQTFDTKERLGHWGFHDAGFVAREDLNGRRFVILKGNRYALCGKPITKILPFIEAELNVKIDLSKEFPRGSLSWQQRMDDDFSQHERSLLQSKFSERISFSAVERARHGSGHSQEDIFWLRTGDGNVRLPDAVVWPATEQEVIDLVKLADSSKWCLIPFGGGTNVINATRCPPKTVEPRPILSVDMKHLNRIEWLNEEDGIAKVQAGIVGRDLVKELEQRGFTMGHEPDSIEFSTLGGWIATKASGMKRSKYGNIEDIVVSCRVVGPGGVLWKGSSLENNRTATGRHSEGLDVCSLAIGSEGCLGIVTSAIIRVCPLPEEREYDGILFPTFDDGLKFLRALTREKHLMPSCVRLLDNEHFRLGQALRPEATSMLEELQAAASKMLLLATLSMNYSSESVVCATINYEGSQKEVRHQISAVRRLAQTHEGVVLGPKVGKAGYELTFMIAYLRDFAVTYHILGESFETFCPWSRIESLVAATKKRIVTEHSSRLLPGLPFVGCRVTQLYHEGVCLYFYLCMSFDGIGRCGTDSPSEVFADLELAARDEILKQGGSLSHHHGVGKLKARFLNQRVSHEFECVVRSIKDSVDKNNIFGARNGVFCDNKSAVDVMYRKNS